MYWQIRRDFVSLFTRTNDKENHLEAIDGLRAIANLLITSLHLVGLLNLLVIPYPHSEWQAFLYSKAFALSNIMSFSLEIFFMLSAFLLTYKLIEKWNTKPTSREFFLHKEYPISILKRILRFWPGLLLASIILLIFGEPWYPNGSYLFEFFRNLNVWMFFQNYINPEYWYFSLTPLWSISLDMQMHLILPLLLYLFYSIRKYLSIYTCLTILLFLSIIRGILVFDPLTMPTSSSAHRYSSIGILSPHYQINWLKTNYNLTFLTDYSLGIPMKFFMQKMYLSLEARFGSFLIGSILAIKLLQTSTTQNNKGKTFPKYFFFGLIFLNTLTLLQGPESPPLPSEFVLKLAIATSRQLFTIGQAFVLFTALCPSSHRYHCSWIKKFLSSQIWIPISKLSYLVYVIHLRIAFELILNGPLRVLKGYSVTYATLISLPVVMISSQLISSIWYILFEKPFERAIKNHLDKYQTSKVYLK